MALFENPTHEHLAALLRQGFAARMRSETADVFLSQQSQSVTLTSARQKASIFFFLHGQGPLTAILAKPPDATHPRFLSLSQQVSVTDAPSLLKLNCAHKSSHLFSISSVAPTSYLSLRGVSINSPAKLASSLSKWELFHLEILPATIGKGFVNHCSTESGFMTVSQALSHAILNLGIRFRLRSVHNRVLRNRKTSVRQDGPKSQIAFTHDTEIVLTPFRSSAASADACFANYALKHVHSEMYLAINPSGAEMVSKEDIVIVRASPNGWGTISVGSNQQGKVRWLMAGPRGRLETRSQPGAWETFTMEFVRQSYDAALRELPVPAIHKIAEAAMRENLRKQVEARVAAAKDAPKQTQRRSEKKKDFNHSKALAGLGDIPVKSQKIFTSTADSKNNNGSPKDETTKKGRKKGGGAQKVAAAASTAALPRNKANKKASRKNRKKKQKAANKATADSSGGSQVAARGLSTRAKPANESEKKNEGTSATTSESLSDAPSKQESKPENSSGPPCSACGRPMIGPYTNALGKKFHPQCFCCGRCRRPMGVGAAQFREQGGVPYCNSCYAGHLASRCARCSQPIMETVVTAMDKTWHKDCLTCTICRLPLTQTFWLYADKPNEPRCSRCVTGDENYKSTGGSRRMVNVPMFGKSSGGSFPSLGSGSEIGGASNSSKGGRARLTTPVLPTYSRR